MAGKRRGHGEGSIYQDSNNRWRAVVDFGWKNGNVPVALQWREYLGI